MYKIVLLCGVLFFVQGCTVSNVITGAKVARTVGCASTSEEWRANVRENQKVIKTDICGDEK